MQYCIPYPAQGHKIPMLKLAKLLHHKGFHEIWSYQNHILPKKNVILKVGQLETITFRPLDLCDGLENMRIGTTTPH